MRICFWLPVCLAALLWSAKPGSAQSTTATDNDDPSAVELEDGREIIVQTQEHNRGRVVIGLGYNSASGLVGSILFNGNGDWLSEVVGDCMRLAQAMSRKPYRELERQCDEAAPAKVGSVLFPFQYFLSHGPNCPHDECLDMPKPLAPLPPPAGSYPYCPVGAVLGPNAAQCVGAACTEATGCAKSCGTSCGSKAKGCGTNCGVAAKGCVCGPCANPPACCAENDCCAASDCCAAGDCCAGDDCCAGVRVGQTAPPCACCKKGGVCNCRGPKMVGIWTGCPFIDLATLHHHHVAPVFPHMLPPHPWMLPPSAFMPPCPLMPPSAMLPPPPPDVALHPMWQPKGMRLVSRTSQVPGSWQVKAMGNHVVIHSPTMEAQCHHVTWGQDRVVLEGNVRLVSRRPGQATRIEAHRVTVDLESGAFTVDSHAAPAGTPVRHPQTSRHMEMRPSKLDGPVAPCSLECIFNSMR